MEDFRGVLVLSKSFAVRVSLYDSKLAARSEKPILEERLGSLFLENFPHLKVDLDSPDAWIRVLYTGEHAIYGCSLCKAEDKGFSRRRPRKRKIFHPATMQPKLARILVNLSGARRGDTVLDPFCGVGGILLEASLLGLQPIGVDLSPWMVEGAKENMEWGRASSLGIIRGDIAYLPIRRADAIVTDPPYGTSASTGGRRPQSLYRALLETAARILPLGSRLVLVHPKSIPLEGCEELNLLEKASYEIRVHKSLTRSIRILEKRDINA
jgi:tRNA (guanine10-N2)-dimethyltransferase